MAKIEIGTDEVEVLEEVLRSYLSELHSEIVHTDRREYREGLKAKEAFLKSLMERLAEVEHPVRATH